MARVAVFGSLPESLINFRGPLLRAMVDAGHEVHAVSPPADRRLLTALTAIGVEHHAVPLARTGLNPWTDLRSLFALTRLMRGLRPDCLLAYTIKAVIYGGLVARLAGVPKFFALISGLGYAFSAADSTSRLLGALARPLYRIALSRAERVFFQNPDNLEVFRGRGLLRRADRALLVNGSGVDLERFSPSALPVAPAFLMIARLLKEKGVVEYVEAARRVKARQPQAVFRLVGWIDDHPDAIGKAELAAWIEEGVIEYLGCLQDVRPAIADTAIYCLPSYHEGMPRTVLEAMAMGRPVITTDVPGCRSTVNDGDNGYLVPARNACALAEAMQRFIAEPQSVAAMGAASRRLAVERFDVHCVNRTMLTAMGLAG